MLSLYAAGFKWKNIYGVDIYSYSPKIKVGSSSKVPFSDNFFDLVIAGWITVYTSEKTEFINELNRITKNGSYFLIGNSQYTQKYAHKFDNEAQGKGKTWSDPAELNDPTRSHSGTLELLTQAFTVEVIAVKHPFPTDDKEDEYLGLYRLWKK